MNGLPELGVGISFRPTWRRDVFSRREQLGCLEIIAEHYLNPSPEKLEELDQLRTNFPVIPHGIGLSFGTDAPLDESHLRKIARLIERVQPAWFSEHVAFTRAHGYNVGHLASLPFTRESVGAIARNVRRWRETVGVPLLLENIAYMVALPGEFSEAQFLSEVLERADCGLLLDLHNLYANAVNHGYDAMEFIESLPLHRVAQIHLAGGYDEDGFRIDSHSAATPEPVWDLLRVVASRAHINAVIIEWDTKLPSLDVMLREVAKAETILQCERHGITGSANSIGEALHGQRVSSTILR
jgi:hypothetical protein